MKVIATWGTSLYLIASFILAISAGINAGPSAGFSLIGASFIGVTGTGGIIHATNQKFSGHTIASFVFGACFLAVGYWLSEFFSVNLFGSIIDGEGWLLIGAGFGYIYGTWGYSNGASQVAAGKAPR